MAVVLVDRNILARSDAAGLVSRLQAQLKHPVMLVARDDATWTNARAHAEFDATPYLYALLATDDLEWSELPAVEEAEVPF